MNIKNIPKHLINLLNGTERLSVIKITPKSNESEKTTLDSSCFFDDTIDFDNNERAFRSLVAIDGCGFSGSSAIGDFLGEFDTVSSFGGVDLRENPERGIENCYEVDFFRESNGILDLERICYTNVGRIRDEAVHNFIKVCEKYRNSGISLFGDYFYNEAKRFIRNITDFTIQSSPEWLTYVPKKLTVQEYRKYAKCFFQSFLSSIKSSDYLVLDNLMSISDPNIDLLYDYFGDFKLIYVYSDPRDIYARARLCPGNDWVPKEPNIFVRSFLRVFPNYLKKSKEINSPILCVSFDDFCNNYDKVSKEIMDFLGLKEESHNNKFKFFDPKVSINNTRVYTKIENQEAIEYIYKELKEYCWENNN